MKKALLVIDVQAGMYTAGIPVHNGEKFLETLQELIGECRSNGIPVIYVQHNVLKGHPLEKRYRWLESACGDCSARRGQYR